MLVCAIGFDWRIKQVPILRWWCNYILRTVSYRWHCLSLLVVFCPFVIAGTFVHLTFISLSSQPSYIYLAVISEPYHSHLAVISEPSHSHIRVISLSSQPSHSHLAVISEPSQSHFSHLLLKSSHCPLTLISQKSSRF